MFDMSLKVRIGLAVIRFIRKAINRPVGWLIPLDDKDYSLYASYHADIADRAKRRKCYLPVWHELNNLIDRERPVINNSDIELLRSGKNVMTFEEHEV